MVPVGGPETAGENAVGLSRLNLKESYLITVRVEGLVYCIMRNVR
jgi:hypothetical protein